MYNDLLTIGPFTLHTYGLMTAIGIVAAYFTAEYRAKKNGLDHTKVFWLVIWCLVFGYLGSKILYFITIFPQIIEDPSVILRSLADGWVVYGGIIGGIIGALIFCRRNKLPTLKYFDIGLASVALAQGFGRLGCFFAGCCYGMQTDSWFSITFTNSNFAPNNVPLVPTQLISSAGDFLLFFLLVLLNRRKNNKPGQGASMYLICYGIGRFIIEFFRGDLIRGSVGTISTSQFISIFVVIAGIIMFIMCTKAKDKRPVINACIFDLDGTLLSTIESIAVPTNKALKEYGFEEHDISKYYYYVGDGFAKCVERALKDAGDEELEKFDEVYAFGKKLYDEDPSYNVKPYDGIVETLERLKNLGIRLAVLSNKPHESAVSVVKKFFGEDIFDIVLGQKEGAPVKPDPSCAKEILKVLDFPVEKICYIGDTDTDMKTGKGAGFYTVGVLWGFRTEKELRENNADMIIRRPEELMEVCKWESIQKNA